MSTQEHPQSTHALILSCACDHSLSSHFFSAIRSVFPALTVVQTTMRCSMMVLLVALAVTPVYAGSDSGKGSGSGKGGSGKGGSEKGGSTEETLAAVDRAVQLATLLLLAEEEVLSSFRVAVLVRALMTRLMVLSQPAGAVAPAVAPSSGSSGGLFPRSVDLAVAQSMARASGPGLTHTVTRAHLLDRTSEPASARPFVAQAVAQTVAQAVPQAVAVTPAMFDRMLQEAVVDRILAEIAEHATVPAEALEAAPAADPTADQPTAAAADPTVDQAVCRSRSRSRSRSRE